MFGMLFDIFFVGFTLYRLIRNSGTWKTAFKAIFEQILLIVFALQYIWVIVTNIVSTAWFTQYRPELSESFGDYYSCLFTSVLPLSQCGMTKYVDNSIIWANVIAFGSIGLLFAIIMLGRRAVRDVLADQWKSLSTWSHSVSSGERIHTSSRKSESIRTSGSSSGH